ncbi:hypothetical protein PSHT_08144 [Puccinia striiformis]|uniref:Aquaporin n=1 Tax=Puccinia striiformis TaxID=27350 RepID=A0A2S4VRT6_9BASI|nr:hypothetical protein PSHT_08144 [Puccinia striiformis]
MSPNATDPHNPTNRRRFAGNSNPAEGGGVVLRFKSYTRTAANNQVALSNSNAVSNAPAGTYLSVAFGWALAVMLGVYVSAGVSGGHINPAITLAMAIFRGFPIYWAAQLTGSVTGAAHAIDLFEGGGGARTIEKTGGLFFTSAVAVGDNGNAAPPKNMGPLVIFWVVFGLASTLGMQVPDLSPGSLDTAATCGLSLPGPCGKPPLSIKNIVSAYIDDPMVLRSGAIVGAFIYDFFIATTQVTCALHGNNSQALPSFLSKIRPAKRNRPEQLAD